MEEKLIQRLEAAVSRLEAISDRRVGVESVGDGADVSSDPSIKAYEDLMGQYLGRVSAAAEKIGGQVLDVTKIVEQAFSVQKELLIKVKQTRKPDMAGLADFFKPLNEVIVKANAMSEGRRYDFFNHLRSAADSLTALAWIAYTGKDCGMSMPIAHVEESWQMAEFYSNKILVKYRGKDPNHVEWAKALEDLYLPGLRDYVKSHYPLGPVWSSTGKTVMFAPSKAPPPTAPARQPGGSAPPPPPHASLFSFESSPALSSRPKEGMAAVCQEISSKPVTAGLRKVTDDMKTKNRVDRTGVVVVATGEKEGRNQQWACSSLLGSLPLSEPHRATQAHGRARKVRRAHSPSDAEEEDVAPTAPVPSPRRSQGQGSSRQAPSSSSVPTHPGFILGSVGFWPDLTYIVRGDVGMDEVRTLSLEGTQALTLTPSDATHVPVDFVDHCYRMSHAAKAALTFQSFSYQRRLEEQVKVYQNLQRRFDSLRRRYSATQARGDPWEVRNKGLHSRNVQREP